MPTQSKEYDFSKIEPYWQDFWEKNKTFKANDFEDKPKYYVLDMLPYPSGAGLHIGHPEGYTASDILCRYKKACGFNVLHPMGWDAFGLPAEQHAINTGTHPAVNTRNNINTFRRQIKGLGFSLDWDREIDSTDEGYYRWTQWIFLQLFKHGLAYVDKKPVWWCPALGTVLANEEVIDGLSERGSHPVERRNLRQWVLRITAYADKLLEGLDTIDWPDSTKRQQIAWIGKSEGADVLYDIEEYSSGKLKVYTTRPDTLYGATFMVLAPEHSFVQKIVKPEHQAEVEAYIQAARHKSDLERTDLAKEKTGVFTGVYALNPLNGKKMPIWIADYVLISYGAGAIVGVPAHDARDYEFALKYNLEIIPVVEPKIKEEEYKLPFIDFSHETQLINSEKFNGQTTEEAFTTITKELVDRGHGNFAVNYKLRDWLFSRQRYWGEPFPVTWISERDYQKLLSIKNSPLHESLPKEPVSYSHEGQQWYAVPMALKDLSLQLPEVSNYLPSGTGESPLANAHSWLYIWLNLETGDMVEGRKDGITVPDKPGTWVEGVRETNTMPQWAGSCWYYLRYLDPRNPEALVDPKLIQYWGTPDFYIGGAEHAVLHLLYARFWHRFLYDIGVLPQPEPFKRLFHQGIILGEDGHKMSKSRGNTVSPDDIVREYGADALRLYEMFLGPLEDMKPWNMRGIEGVFRFLKKVWREFVDADGNVNEKIVDAHSNMKHANSKDTAVEFPETLSLLHQTIKKVTEDIENLKFNTAISQMMIFVNHLQKQLSFTKRTGTIFIQLLAPFAPHIAEELWGRLGNAPSISSYAWPEYDPKKIEQDTAQIVIQVNGKVRAELQVSKKLSQEEVLSLVKSQEKIQPFLHNKQIVKEIYVPGKLVNLVIS